jgi:hypothetical protein
MKNMSDLAEFLKARLNEKARQARFRLEDTDSQSGAFELDADEALAEVEAMRRILELHKPVDDGSGIQLVCPTCSRPDGYENLLLTAPCPTLRILALPYDYHEEYNEAWRP